MARKSYSERIIREVTTNIFEILETHTDKTLKEIVKKAASFNERNCWYKEFIIKDSIVAAAKSIIEHREAARISKEFFAKKAN